MTEVAESFPELGAKSPEKPKPRSAPKGSTRGRDNNGKKPRERKEIPDDGAPLVPPTAVAEPSQEEQETKEAKIKTEIDDMNKKVVGILSPFPLGDGTIPTLFRSPCAHRQAARPTWR